MTRLLASLLALALAAPSPACAASAASVVRGRPGRVAPVTLALPALGVAPAPMLAAPALSAPTLSAPALLSAPRLHAPAAAPAASAVSADARAEAPVAAALPASAIPSASAVLAAEAAAPQAGSASASLEQAAAQEAAAPAGPSDGSSSALFDGSSKRPLRLLIMGPPASGKGTFAERLERDYGVVHISAGELLRAHAKAHPEIAAVMQKGDLVPTELVVGLVRDRLSQADVKERGFILDGFPRRLVEAKALQGMLASEGIVIDAAIRLDAPEKVLLGRILARGRADDSEPTFRNRMKIYKHETKPAMSLISKGTTVLRPHLEGSDIPSNYAKVKGLLDAFLRGEPVGDGLGARLRRVGQSLLPAGAPGERKLALLLAGWNFLTIATYYILAPVRGAFLLTNFGPEALPWVYMVGAAVTGLAVWGYGSLSKLPRRWLIGGALGVLTLALGGWWAVGLAASQVPAVSFAYYIFGDLFSIMSVTLMWTYANDRFGPDSAKKYFGLVAAAGPLGAIVGSLVTRQLVGVVGVLPLLLAAAVAYAGTLGLFALAERVRYQKPPSEAPQAQPKPEKGMLKTIFTTPFLGFLALLVLLERLVPDFGNYIFNAAVYEAYPAKEAMVRFGASYGLWQNVVSLFASLFLTRWILRKLGAGKALMGPALSLIVGLPLFAISPTLAMAVGFNALEGLQRYTWFKSAKEATYTVGSRDVIYRFKAFIEMFVYRFARGLAGLILLLLTHQAFLAWGVTGVALAGVPFAALWLYAAWRVGKEFEKAESAKK